MRTFLSAPSLHSELPTPFLIDTRAAEDFEVGHIPGALNVPDFFTYLLPNSGPEGVAAMADHFKGSLEAAGLGDLKRRVVVYEESMESCKGASCRAAFILRWLGFSDVAVLDGGIEAWIKAGLPVTKDVVAAEKASLTLALNSHLMASVEDVKRAVEQGSGLLDDRDEDEWTGHFSSPYGVDYCPRKGRIPGAKWVLWTDLMLTSEGVTRMKSGEEIRALCSKAGFQDLHQPIIVYCFKGARASNTFLAMEHAGYTDLRIYFASWNEWSRNNDLPIDDTRL